MKTIFLLLAATLPLSAQVQHSDFMKSMEADSRAASIRNQLSTDSQMLNQHIDNLADQIKSSQMVQPASPLASAALMQLTNLTYKHAALMEEHEELVKKYNALLLQVQSGSRSENSSGASSDSTWNIAHVLKEKFALADENKRLNAELDETIKDYNDMVERNNAYKKKIKAARKASDDLTDKMYPDANIKDSPLVKRALEIHRKMISDGDPRSEGTDISWIVYSQAAKELGIKPTNP